MTPWPHDLNKWKKLVLNELVKISSFILVYITVCKSNTILPCPKGIILFLQFFNYYLAKILAHITIMANEFKEVNFHISLRLVLDLRGHSRCKNYKFSSLKALRILINLLAVMLMISILIVHASSKHKFDQHLLMKHQDFECKISLTIIHTYT